MSALASIAGYLLVGLAAAYLAWLVATAAELFADSGCTCAKGKRCAKCLAESEAIRGGGGA